MSCAPVGWGRRFQRTNITDLGLCPSLGKGSVNAHEEQMGAQSCDSVLTWQEPSVPPWQHFQQH